MTVENLALHNEGKRIENRRAAIARRSTLDQEIRQQRQTLEKDSFLAFGHNEDGTEIAPATTFQNFTD
jgi:hypothetical protein